MERPSQPAEIARETIKRLTQRKLPPTPDNYRRFYAEVAGEEASGPAWPEAIRALLAQWDTHHAGLTQNKKREMIERVLINFGNQPHELHEKLLALVRSWAESGGSKALVESGAMSQVEAGGEAAPEPAGEAPAAGREAEIGRALCDSLAELGAGCETLWPDLAEAAKRLAGVIEGSAFALSRAHISTTGQLWREVMVRAEDNVKLLEALRRILVLLFENVGDMLADDPWMQRRIAMVHDMIAGSISPYGLYDAESSLQEVVERQKAIQADMQEAKSRLKGLITTFIDRVGEMADTAGEHHERIQTYAEQIAAADDIGQLNVVMESLTAEVTHMRDQIRGTHEELVKARQDAVQSEQRIQELETELEKVASLMREDQLTGALNRRGLDEAFERESSRAERMTQPLTLSVLDIDHFKKINDTYGHQVGDQALVHLAQVVRQLLRPTDVLGRYGGEEFLIVLPNTALDEAERIMQRVQRELTKRFFLHDNQRILITFSAGIAERRPAELQTHLVERADQAMYRAKTLGRNRVERAE